MKPVKGHGTRDRQLSFACHCRAQAVLCLYFCCAERRRKNSVGNASPCMLGGPRPPINVTMDGVPRMALVHAAVNRTDSRAGRFLSSGPAPGARRLPADPLLLSHLVIPARGEQHDASCYRRAQAVRCHCFCWSSAIRAREESVGNSLLSRKRVLGAGTARLVLRSEGAMRMAPLIIFAANRCPVVAERIDFSWIGPEHVKPFVELCTDRRWMACN